MVSIKKCMLFLMILPGCASFKFGPGDCVQIDNQEILKIVSICSHPIPMSHRAEAYDGSERWKYETRDFTGKYSKFDVDFIDKFNGVACHE